MSLVGGSTGQVEQSSGRHRHRQPKSPRRLSHEHQAQSIPWLSRYGQGRRETTFPFPSAALTKPSCVASGMGSRLEAPSRCRSSAPHGATPSGCALTSSASTGWSTSPTPRSQTADPETRPMDQHSAALDRAHRHALDWLASLADRPVPPQASIDQVTQALGTALPDNGSDPADVVDLLAEACDPGLTAMGSGRFFGFVIGGTHPAALAADWLVSAWDQNSGLRRVTPAHSAVEDVTSAWLLDLLGLPGESAVGFVTGGTMANFTGLAAGRDAVLRKAGWDVAQRGLGGGPRVRVIVGAERHDTVDLALRYLGLGSPEQVPVDEQGRLRADALQSALDEGSDEPTIVVLQAGNVHSGAFDPFAEAITVAHAHGAWVHVDGAFGLWAAASPSYRHLVLGCEAADSWATDAHKTLNVPYDTGLAIVRDAAALRASMGMHGAY